MQPDPIAGPEAANAAASALFVLPKCDSFRENALLLGIADQAYEQVRKTIEIVHLAPRQILFEEDDLGEAVYLIAKGSVKISKRGRGGQQETLTYLMENDFFGEMALVDSGKRSAQAAAVDHTILGKIDRAGWDLLLRVAPHVILGNFTRAITRRLRHNNQHFIEEMMRNERLTLLGTTISSIVHDMNNPIACILGACEVMQTKIHNELTTKMVGMIRDAVEKMETMTRELIDYSRGSTELHLQALTVEELLQYLRPDFAKCGSRVEVHLDILYDGLIEIDRHRILRVFGNLIRNAREAMKNDKDNHLHFVVKRIDSNVRFEVSDTGCGIPADFLPRIFEPFMTHGKANGTGLGLAISRAVIEAHGGTIAVRSSEAGTTFQIDLPLRPLTNLP
jgi:signal transduction histidine kinase